MTVVISLEPEGEWWINNYFYRTLHDRAVALFPDEIEICETINLGGAQGALFMEDMPIEMGRRVAAILSVAAEAEISQYRVEIEAGCEDAEHRQRLCECFSELRTLLASSRFAPL